MGSCAFLMPVGSVRFIREGRYALPRGGGPGPRRRARRPPRRLRRAGPSPGRRALAGDRGRRLHRGRAAPRGPARASPRRPAVPSPARPDAAESASVPARPGKLTTIEEGTGAAYRRGDPTEDERHEATIPDSLPSPPRPPAAPRSRRPPTASAAPPSTVAAGAVADRGLAGRGGRDDRCRGAEHHLARGRRARGHAARRATSRRGTARCAWSRRRRPACHRSSPACASA